VDGGTHGSGLTPKNLPILPTRKGSAHHTCEDTYVGFGLETGHLPDLRHRFQLVPPQVGLEEGSRRGNPPQLEPSVLEGLHQTLHVNPYLDPLGGGQIPTFDEIQVFFLHCLPGVQVFPVSRLPVPSVDIRSMDEQTTFDTVELEGLVEGPLDALSVIL
jgi:hypothetical protein